MFSDVKVTDGGFSTQLGKYVGHNFDKDPLFTTRFLSTNPEVVKNVHLDFLRAGSDIIETNTYQASVEGFKKYLNIGDEESIVLIKKAADLAKEAVEIYKNENPDANPQIFGSIGPYGTALHDCSEYTGSYADTTPDEKYLTWHRPRFEALLERGITNFAIETLPCEREALVLAEFIKNYPQIKAWFSFSCKDDKHVAHGEEFQSVAANLYNTNSKQILAVGVNCLSPLFVSNLLKGVNANNKMKIPFVVYPNNKDIFKDGEWQENVVPSLYTFVREWLELGVKYIGGCCRTYASDIVDIRNEVDKIKSD